MNAGGRFTVRTVNGIVCAECTSFASCVDRQTLGSANLSPSYPFRSRRFGHGIVDDERSRDGSYSTPPQRSPITKGSKSCCRSISWRRPTMTPMPSVRSLAANSRSQDRGSESSGSTNKVSRLCRRFRSLAWLTICFRPSRRRSGSASQRFPQRHETWDRGRIAHAKGGTGAFEEGDRREGQRPQNPTGPII